MSLFGLAVLLILLGVFLAGLHVLVTVGIILLVVALVAVLLPGAGPYRRWPF